MILTKLLVIPKKLLPLMIGYEGSQNILKASSLFFKHKTIAIYSNIKMDQSMKSVNNSLNTEAVKLFFLQYLCIHICNTIFTAVH